ncbi:MAG: radical SAM family heme chaperone HemW [Bacteroidales bacterium]|nr:radical SAM family heme chaperone HemW [Bacteroidales bacterium]
MFKSAPQGLYIHIPFCKSRCIYCGFFSQTNFSYADAYVDALIFEMQQYDLSAVRTIYIGGGTPSTLGGPLLVKLLNYLRDSVNMALVCEFTIECNPDDIDEALAELLHSYGVSRVSMGVQSMNDKMLKFLNRRHTASQVYCAISTLEKYGIHNINIDFIFGMPLFDWYDFEHDFEQFATIETTHKSIYALSYETDTPLMRMLENKSLTPCPDDDVRQQYEHIIERMRQLGYEHYEISNYALPKYRAVHNSNYWNRTSYVGVGVGSSSFWNMHRHTNNMSIKDYCHLHIEQKAPIYEADELTQHDVYNETIMLGLRTIDGVDANALKHIGNDYYEYFVSHASRLKKSGNIYYIDESDWFISDDIVSSLFM